MDLEQQKQKRIHIDDDDDDGQTFNVNVKTIPTSTSSTSSKSTSKSKSRENKMQTGVHANTNNDDDTDKGPSSATSSPPSSPLSFNPNRLRELVQRRQKLSQNGDTIRIQKWNSWSEKNNSNNNANGHADGQNNANADTSTDSQSHANKSASLGNIHTHNYRKNSDIATDGDTNDNLIRRSLSTNIDSPLLSIQSLQSSLPAMSKSAEIDNEYIHSSMDNPAHSTHSSENSHSRSKSHGNSNNNNKADKNSMVIQESFIKSMDVTAKANRTIRSSNSNSNNSSSGSGNGSSNNRPINLSLQYPTLPLTKSLTSSMAMVNPTAIVPSEIKASVTPSIASTATESKTSLTEMSKRIYKRQQSLLLFNQQQKQKQQQKQQRQQQKQLKQQKNNLTQSEILKPVVLNQTQKKKCVQQEQQQQHSSDNVSDNKVATNSMTITKSFTNSMNTSSNNTMTRALANSSISNSDGDGSSNCTSSCTSSNHNRPINLSLQCPSLPLTKSVASSMAIANPTTLPSTTLPSIETESKTSLTEMSKRIYKRQQSLLLYNQQQQQKQQRQQQKKQQQRHQHSNMNQCEIVKPVDMEQTQKQQCVQQEEQQQQPQPQPQPQQPVSLLSTNTNTNIYKALAELSQKYSSNNNNNNNHIHTMIQAFKNNINQENDNNGERKNYNDYDDNDYDDDYDDLSSFQSVSLIDSNVNIDISNGYDSNISLDFMSVISNLQENNHDDHDCDNNHNDDNDDNSNAISNPLSSPSSPSSSSPSLSSPIDYLYQLEWIQTPTTTNTSISGSTPKSSTNKNIVHTRNDSKRPVQVPLPVQTRNNNDDDDSMVSSLSFNEFGTSCTTTTTTAKDTTTCNNNSSNSTATTVRRMLVRSIVFIFFGMVIICIIMFMEYDPMQKILTLSPHSMIDSTTTSFTTLVTALRTCSQTLMKKFDMEDYNEKMMSMKIIIHHYLTLALNQCWEQWTYCNDYFESYVLTNSMKQYIMTKEWIMHSFYSLRERFDIVPKTIFDTMMNVTIADYYIKNTTFVSSSLDMTLMPFNNNDTFLSLGGGIRKFDNYWSASTSTSLTAIFENSILESTEEIMHTHIQHQQQQPFCPLLLGDTKYKDWGFLPVKYTIEDATYTIKSDTLGSFRRRRLVKKLKHNNPSLRILFCERDNRGTRQSSTVADLIRDVSLQVFDHKVETTTYSSQEELPFVSTDMNTPSPMCPMVWGDVQYEDLGFDEIAKGRLIVESPQELDTEVFVEEEIFSKTNVANKEVFSSCPSPLQYVKNKDTGFRPITSTIENNTYFIKVQILHAHQRRRLFGKLTRFNPGFKIIICEAERAHDVARAESYRRLIHVQSWSSSKPFLPRGRNRRDSNALNALISTATSSSTTDLTIQKASEKDLLSTPCFLSDLSPLYRSTDNALNPHCQYKSDVEAPMSIAFQYLHDEATDFHEIHLLDTIVDFFKIWRRERQARKKQKLLQKSLKKQLSMITNFILAGTVVAAISL